MKKYLFNFVVLGIGAIFFAFVIGSVMAQDVVKSLVKDVQYPVKELSNCANENECKIYCDKTENIDSCLSFAEKNNLMSEEEIKIAKNFTGKEMKGPGGCDGKDKCDIYCDDMDNMDECVSFAEKNNLMSANELEQAKKVQAAIKRGVKPPACGNKNECDTYCEEANHMEECINFGVEAGFIQGEELENAQKMLSALKRGIKPPPCNGKDACDEYCGNPDNMEICMNFAMEAGMMSDQEKENSQKMLQAIKKGVKPPNCKGKEECDAFCQSEEHMDECINFSVAAGMMDEKQAEMAKKTRGKGPGGCIGKEACDVFCQDNQEECFKFGVENGMIPPEEIQKMEQNKANFKQTFNNLPPVVETCLKEFIGSEQVEKFKSGEIMPPKEIGDKMKNCFEKMGPPNPGEPGAGGMIPPAGQAGPGGCKTQEECQQYCESNPEECQKFQPSPGMINPGEQMMSQQAGPGGCKSPEECDAFCKSNPDQCGNFNSAGGEQFVAPGMGMGMGGDQQPMMSQSQIEMQKQIDQQTGQYIQQIQQNVQQFPQDQQLMMEQKMDLNQTNDIQYGPDGGLNMKPGPEGFYGQQPMMEQPMEQQFMQEQQPMVEPPSSDGQLISENTQKQFFLANVITAFLLLFR
ncbi:MAG: hypothetical protein ABH951_01345 [Patescibacteria group bacterium]